MVTYEGKYITCEDKWVVDLTTVEFISLKQSWETQNFHIKLHIGQKEVRIELDSMNDVQELIEWWKKTNR